MSKRGFAGGSKTATRQGSDDTVRPYVEALGTVLDVDAIRLADVRIGVDPLGGASVN